MQIGTATGLRSQVFLGSTPSGGTKQWECGEIGIPRGLKIPRLGMWVRLPPLLPNVKHTIVPVKYGLAGYTLKRIWGVSGFARIFNLESQSY